LGIGDWGLGPIPNPQSPIPNPQSPIPNPHVCLSNYLSEYLYDLFFIYILKYNNNIYLKKDERK
jgi:hypothetical protein